MVYIIHIRIVYMPKKKHWDKSDKTSLVGKKLKQCMNDYKEGGSF